MPDIRFDLLQPVDTGAQVQQGFATGMAMVKGIQSKNALKAYLANPDDPNAYSALAYLDPQMADQAQRQHFLRQKMVQDQQDRQRAVALGSLAATDPSAARQEALSAGDFDLAKTFGELSEAEQKKTADFWGKAGAVAYRLKQTPDPEARKALWAQTRPILEAEGAPAHLLDSFDPTNDTQLEAAITTAQGIDKLVEQSRVTWHQQGEQPSFATDFMGRPIGTQNPYANGGGAPPPSGGQPTPRLPAPVATAVGGTLSSAGIPAPVVAGVLGNWDVEGGHGGAQGDGGASGGLGQWNGERRTNFQRVIGKDPTQATPEENAHFFLWEMQNPEAAGMTVQQRDAILAAPDAATAADLIDRFYERSSGEHRQLRIAAAARHAGTASPSENLPAPKSQAEFASLPSGTIFMAPDGTRRRKP